MDQFKERLQHDVRLLKRDLRNHLISEKQIQAIQDDLADSIGNAQWIQQDGTLCSEEEKQILLRYHKNGWDELLYGTGSTTQEVSASDAGE